MLRRSIVFILGLFVAALLALAPAEAGQAGRGAGADERAGKADRAAGPLSPAEVVAMLDAYAVVQAQDALALNDAQYPAFVTRLRKLQETRRRNQQARNKVLQELRQLAGPQAGAQVDENAIREKLKALREIDDRAAAELRRAYDALDEVMDVRQQARFRMFEEAIERRKLDLLMRARQGARRGGS